MSNSERSARKHIPSPRDAGSAISSLKASMEEMESIVAEIRKHKKLLDYDDRAEMLFRMGSYLYEFYVAVEEGLLAAARHLNRWVPYSLDWHELLLRIMQKPLGEFGMPVLSPPTAARLEKYLYFYLAFPNTCTALSPAKVKELVGDLETVHGLLQSDFQGLQRILEGLHGQRRGGI